MSPLAGTVDAPAVIVLNPPINDGPLALARDAAPPISRTAPSRDMTLLIPSSLLSPLPLWSRAASHRWTSRSANTSARWMVRPRTVVSSLGVPPLHRRGCRCQFTVSLDMPDPVHSTARPQTILRFRKGALPTAVPGPKPPPGGTVSATTVPVLVVQVTMNVPAASPTTPPRPLSVRADRRIGAPQVPPAGRTETYVGLPVDRS